MTVRSGVPTMMLVARKLCVLIVKFTPTIERLYPSNTALMAALLAANEACAALQSELAEVREYGT